VEPPSSVAGLAFSMQVAMREWRKARVSLEEMGHDMKEQTKQVAANPVGAVANGVANGVGSCVHGVHEVTTEVGKGIQHRVAQMSRDIEVFKSQRLEPDVTRRKRKAARERGERASLSRFYRTPAVKFLFRFFAFLAYLMIICALTLTFRTALDPSSKERGLVPSNNVAFPDMLECIWLIFQVGYLLETMQQAAVSRRLGFYMSAEGNIWVRAKMGAWLLLVAAVGLRVIAMFFYRTETIEIYSWLLDCVQVAISANGLLLVLSFLPQIAQFSTKLGELVLILENMVSDFVLFLVIHTVFVVAFILLFFGLDAVNQFREQDKNGVPVIVDPAESPLSAPYMVSFGELPVDRIRWPAAIAMYIFGFLVNVMLVNLLIAMFSDTYRRCNEDSEAEFCYRKNVLLYLQRHVALSMPPPFNIPFALRDLLLGLGLGSDDKLVKKRVRLTAANALKKMASQSDVLESASKAASMAESDPRDGVTLVEAFLKKRAEAAAERVEVKRDRQHLEMMRRLDALAMRLDRVEESNGDAVAAAAAGASYVPSPSRRVVAPPRAAPRLSQMAQATPASTKKVRNVSFQTGENEN